MFHWLLQAPSPDEYERLLPKLLAGLFTQAALNNGTFIEEADFSCCGILMPPGSDVENPLTTLSAGLASFIWTLGLSTFKAWPTLIFPASPVFHPLINP
jgi:hypothetical protein